MNIEQTSENDKAEKVRSLVTAGVLGCGCVKMLLTRGGNPPHGDCRKAIRHRTIRYDGEHFAVVRYTNLSAVQVCCRYNPTATTIVATNFLVLQPNERVLFCWEYVFLLTDRKSKFA